MPGTIPTRRLTADSYVAPAVSVGRGPGAEKPPPRSAPTGPPTLRSVPRAASALLLFDLGNTLIDRRAAFRRWAEDWCGRSGLGAEGVAWLEAASSGRSERDFFEAVVERFGLDTDPDVLNDAFQIDFPRFFEPDPAVIGSLGRLRSRDWKVGVLTNGTAAQRAKFVAAALGDVVDAACFSDEIGARKPDPAMFQAAASATGAALAGGWIIGDHPWADIRGGAAVGLRTLWISHGRPWPIRRMRPDVVEPSIHAALDFLEGLAPPPRNANA